LWAWGWRDKFPDDAARAGLVQMVRALLPAAAPALRAMPSNEPSVGAPSVALPDALATYQTETGLVKLNESGSHAAIMFLSSYHRTKQSRTRFAVQSQARRVPR
jgi:hypothetical protein